ncbi:MAG TPA: oligosaccharide flippase family protein [Actinocrinis sp.]|nr:oligosaccharide flippase family protein [Actinocrinis sp.]
MAENPARSNRVVAVLAGYLLLVEIVPSGWVVSPLGGAGAPADIYALLAFLWYGGSWLAGRVSPAPNTHAPRVAVFLFSAAVLAGYVSLADVTRQAGGLEIQAADRGLIALAAWIGVVVMASAGIRSYEELQHVLRRAVQYGSVIGVIAVFESFTASNILAGVHFPGLRPATTVTDQLVRGSLTRPISLASDPLELAGVLAMLLPFAIQQALDPDRADRSFVRRWFPVAAIGGALPFTVSKTSIVGLVVVLLMLIPSWPAKRRRPALAVLLVSVAAMKVAVPGLVSTTVNSFSTFFSNSDNSTQARTQDYAGVAQYVQQRPWFGRGFGTFIPSLYRYTDNMYLLGLVEIGIVGVLAILAMYLIGYRCGRVGRRLAVDDSRRELGQCFAAAMAAALVLSGTFDSLGFPMFAELFFLLLGCSGAYLGIMRREATDRNAETMIIPGTAVAVLAAAASPGRMPSMRTRPREVVGPRAYPLFGQIGWSSLNQLLQPDRRSLTETTLSIPKIRDTAEERARYTSAADVTETVAIPNSPGSFRAIKGDDLEGSEASAGDGDDPGQSAESDQELTARVHKGVRWSFINTVVMRLGNFLTGVFLARGVLGPAEWGLYAIGLAVLAVMLAANEMGVSLAIIRWEGDIRRFAPTVLTMSTLSSTILYVLLYFAAPEASRLLGSPDAVSMLRVLGIAVIIDGISCVPGGVLTRTFAQRQRMWIDGANFLISTVLTVVLALDHFGAMSFAWGSVTGNVVGLIGCAVCAPGMLRPGWNRAQARELLRFGLPLAGASLLVLMMLNVDSAVVGVTLGPVSLGLYQIAFNMSSWPVRSVSEIARRVSFAGFSRIAESGRLAEGFGSSLSLLMAASVPPCVLLATLSKPLILFVYGDKWTLASGALSFLAMLGLLRVAFELAYDCLVAAGRKRALILTQGWWLVALIPTLIFAARDRGIAGVGAGHILVAGPLVTPLFLWALSQAGISPTVVAKACARPFAGGLLMGAIAFGVEKVGTEQLHLGQIAAMFAAAVPATVAYFAVVWPMRRMLRPAPAEAVLAEPVAAPPEAEYGDASASTDALTEVTPG